MRMCGALERGSAPLQTSPRQGATAPWTVGFESGDLGRGIVGDAQRAGRAMPLPKSPDQIEGSKGLKPLAGGVWGGQSPPQATAP
ncbi:hypothetical protein Rmf_02510 [Roseomonas fluvialis]|uniref:Uncharacterized protein n=1 Tax=Roseomonas fluvialis TaxID=1750527 RepID=A0ABM7XXX3_9PROT|nr:hypothetical protein Rmf_02510 [Roseomonas fluvialis]